MIAAGVDRRWLDRQVATGMWREVLPGVLAIDGAHRSGDVQLWAALAHAGVGAALSHDTALGLWLPASKGLDRTNIHVSIPHGRRVKALASLVIHQRTSRTVLDFQGLPIVDPVGALADMASSAGLNDFRCLAFDAFQANLLTPSDLRNTRHVRQRDRRFLRLVAEEADAGAVSGGEACYWRLLRNSHLPIPELNVPIWVDGRRYVLDALWPELRLASEIDGRSFHALQHAFSADRTRNNRIQIQGTLVIHFAVDEVFSRPASTLDMTEDAMRSRAAELGIAWESLLRRRVRIT